MCCSNEVLIGKWGKLSDLSKKKKKGKDFSYFGVSQITKRQFC